MECERGQYMLSLEYFSIVVIIPEFSEYFRNHFRNNYLVFFPLQYIKNVLRVVDQGGIGEENKDKTGRTDYSFVGFSIVHNSTS